MACDVMGQRPYGVEKFVYFQSSAGVAYVLVCRGSQERTATTGVKWGEVGRARPPHAIWLYCQQLEANPDFLHPKRKLIPLS